MPAPTEAAIQEWIDWAEKKYGQFLDPARYGKPKDNPGNGMWMNDAKRWANYTPEQKRQSALMNLGPYIPDRKNHELIARDAADRFDYLHGQGRYRMVNAYTT